jgi:hypothetical protein
MGLWQKLFGPREDASVVRDGDELVLKDAAVARQLVRPVAPYFDDAPTPPCERCGQALDEVVITTGGRFGDPQVWRAHPIAVDGWACVPCGVLRYPRKRTPEQINGLNKLGAKYGEAGRLDEAERVFLRMTWDWPGYLPGHLNLAEALRQRHFNAEPHDKRRLVERMIRECELAMAGFADKPQTGLAEGAAHALTMLVELELGRGHVAEARGHLDALEALPLSDERKASTTALRELVDKRLDLLRQASTVVEPYLHLAGRPGKPIATGEERKRLVDALDMLEEHVAAAPERWEGAWLYAKTEMALSGKAGLATFRQAYEAHPGVATIAKDFSLDLLNFGENGEARNVARAIHAAVPGDAALLANLAVTELLNGDLAAAIAAVEASLVIDPKDAITLTLKTRLATYTAGKPLPRTLQELEGRAAAAS